MHWRGAKLLSPYALDDLNVIEIGDFISAPFCAKLLADLGAEVIKVEKPGTGDASRRYGPFVDDSPDPERSGLFIYLNTNKLGVTLDIATPGGAKIFREMLLLADIVIENTPVGFLDGHGLGYEALNAIKPDLIMVSITPFGQTGPYSSYKSSDLVTSHIGGLAYTTPDVKSRDYPPVKSSTHQADLTAGLTGAVATLSAIMMRTLTGRGQHIDISEHETMVSELRYGIDLFTSSGEVPDRFGPAARNFGPHGNFRCKDGYINLTCLNDQQWGYFKDALGRPEWADSEVFDTGPQRGEYRDALEPLVEEWTIERTKDEIYRHMQSYHFPAFPVNTIEEFVASDHFNARELFTEISHPRAGQIRLPRPPYIFSSTSPGVRLPAPMAGQHNDEVFCGRLGLSLADFVRLRQTGVI